MDNAIDNQRWSCRGCGYYADRYTEPESQHRCKGCIRNGELTDNYISIKTEVKPNE